MITINDIKKIADEAIFIARKLGYKVDFPIEYKINNRFVRCLGKFKCKHVIENGVKKTTFKIEISNRFVSDNYEFIDTVRHEVAHFIAYVNFENLSHDEQWKKIAKEIGAKPETVAMVERGILKEAKPRKKHTLTRAKCFCSPKIYKASRKLLEQIQYAAILCPECKIRSLYIVKI